MHIQLPFSTLPENKSKRAEILHSYFSDLRCKSVLNNGVWELELFWPPALDYYIDPSIELGLTWWGNGVRCETIHAQYKDIKHFQLSLNDSWTLYAWSKWLQQESQKKEIQEVIIIHIDDHDDLMCPRIAQAGSQFKDLITGKPVNLLFPDSVKNSILSGAIGIGSFIVPFLHTIPKVHLYHICATAYSVERKHINHLVKKFKPDDLLHPGILRPNVEFKSDRIQIHDAAEYKVTTSYDDCFSNMPLNIPILLHIDMDYFNNRYNGDSDWELHTKKHDPEFAQIQAEINLLFTKIKQYNLADRILNSTVALSPGFFPAEFWEKSINELSKSFDDVRLQP